MSVNHTKEVEKRVEAIQITALDSCSFYAPKEGSLLVVNLCTYCKFSSFEEKSKIGYCKYHINVKKRD